MARIGEDFPRRPFLDQASRVEHAHSLAHARDDAEIMADEEDRGAEFAAQPRNEIEDFRFHGRVEPGRRLVEHQKVRIRGERHGEHDALLLAAGELMRVAAKHAGRIGDLHRFQHRAGGLHRRGPVEAAMETVDLGDLAADRERRVQRAAGILIDHRHPVAAQAAKLRFPGRREVDALEA